MEDLQKLALRHELLRELDQGFAQLGKDLAAKADTKDVTYLATEVSKMQLDQSERNRSLRDSVSEVERAVKALALLVAEQPGANRGGRFSLRELDPRMLVVAGLAVGAAGGKAIEALIGGGF